MTSFLRSCLLCCALNIIPFILSSPANAATCDPWAAQAASVQGSVEVQAAGESGWAAVTLNQALCPGDTIRVGDNGRASLLLANQSVLRLNAGSAITLEGSEGAATSVVDLQKGAAHFFSRIFNGLKVKTPFLTAGVRGTEFFIGVKPDRTDITIFEGGVLAANDQGELSLAGGQSAQAMAGQAPTLKTVVRPRDAVQWALYYPPVIYKSQATGADTNDPRFLVQRAAERLSIGQIDGASADIDRALSLDAANGDALALQAIIAVVRNEKENALALANQAADAAPGSATPRIALSYAQQASFALDKARESLKQAVELEPQNALAWARLAELNMSFGDLDNALGNAQRAASIDPDLSRTQTVLGFARLTQVKTALAAEAFTQAIALDPADPLPRLGLGLAKIRDGNLQEGRQEIETAASLDPNSSLIRSYLGKAYFEEKNAKYDGREYAEAKKLDPNDPTPWFYDAIRKQTINRPVEALQDLQTAIELNDNRAVYRSKLLLDSDLAARSASLARIYGDLGFQQRALAEGYSAVNTDPGNHSAHRFLADSYAALPRHEIARVSELLQSQLLQPSNITPIQPGLAESNLFLISSSGAADTSFNEFNPMFNRNRAALQVSGMAGDNSTSAGEGVVSAIYKNLSLSAGLSHFETDGWRDNADQDDDIGNFFVQYELNYKTSIQAEYRQRERESGDLQQRFFEDDFLANLRQDEELRTFRIGGRHAFSSQSILLGNFARQDAERSEDDNPIPEFTSKFEGEDDAYSGELSYMFSSKRYQIVTGVGHFDINRKDEFMYVTTPPPIVIPPPFPGPPPIVIVPPPVTFDPILDSDIRHTNAYAYFYFKPVDKLTISVGASADLYKEDIDVRVTSPTPASEKLEIEESKFNPKFGVAWTPFDGTTVRAAVFRTLKRTLLTDQTLEPTQVAGFNQFFDDDNVAEAWVYGAGIDQKISNNLFGGAQYTFRDLVFPDFSLSPPTTTIDESEWDEHLARAYIYWAPLSSMSLSAEYLYERSDRDEGFADGAKKFRTHSVPLTINFFHPTGISAMVKGTYVNQEGEFDRRENSGVFVEGNESFWVIDAALSYRCIKRYGILSLGVTNMFDNAFQFYDSDRDNPRFKPERSFYCKLTLSF